MSSTNCARSDVILLPIPFTDLSSRKVRPAIVIGKGTFAGDLFVVPLTSTACCGIGDLHVQLLAT